MNHAERTIQIFYFFLSRLLLHNHTVAKPDFKNMSYKCICRVNKDNVNISHLIALQINMLQFL